jgi:hypothetical protein
MQISFRRIIVLVVLISMGLSLQSSPIALADQVGGQELYSQYWKFGERITITQCVGLVKYKSWGRTKMSGPPEFQVRVGGKWKTVAQSKIVSNSDGCAKQSDFSSFGIKVDRIVLVKFSWTVGEIGDGTADPRYSGCKGSARQLQVQSKFPNSPYPPRPVAVVVCS